MLRAAIYDNNRQFAEKAKDAIDHYMAERHIKIQFDILENEKDLRKHFECPEGKPNLIFICADDPEPKGIALARQVSRKYPGCSIVFTANDFTNQLAAYWVKHCCFVLKSDFEKQLGEIFSLFYQYDGEDASVLVSMRGKKKILHIKNIRYIERGRRKCYIGTDEGEITVANRFEELYEQITATCFVRCHNSFIVNLNEVDNYEVESIFLRDGKEISVSRRYKADVKHAVETWIRR